MKRGFIFLFSIGVAVGAGFFASYFAVNGARFAFQNGSEILKPVFALLSFESLASEGEIIQNDSAGSAKEKSSIEMPDSIQTISPSEEIKMISESPDKLSKITAKSYLVADIESGQILLSKNASVVRPIASISKLFTAYVSGVKMDQAAEAIVSARAFDTRETAGELVLGERLSIGNLLYPLLLESSNDAAEVIAEYFGRDKFILEMNTIVRALGLTHTKFSDPSGLSNQNISNTEDLFAFVRELYLSRSNILAITRMDRYQIPNHRWVNASLFVKDDGYLGGKSGFTGAAGHTLISIFNIKTSTGDRRIAFITLLSENKEADMRQLVGYITNALK